MNFNDMIDDIINEGSKRWNNIEEISECIKADLKNGKDVDVNNVAELLTLLVAHLRPMNPSKESIEAVKKDLKNILKGE